jgi:acetyl esterase
MPSDIATLDLEYLRHGERAMMLTLHKPAGDGPHPFVVDPHGGAWNKGDRSESAGRRAVLAEAGIAAAALDFRQAADGYPSSLVDINFALRWLKAKAGEFGLDPARAGIVGQSSGGHLAMLAAMRPDDPRYAAIPLPEDLSPRDAPWDATVRCVAMTWPVINPLSRYRHALRERASATPPSWIGDIPERHDTYWRTEDAMAEGNPTVALERGETLRTPPALWVQPRPDPVHDYNDPDSDFDGNEPDRFAARYRARGGEIEIREISPADRATGSPHHMVAEFCRGHLISGDHSGTEASAA